MGPGLAGSESPRLLGCDFSSRPTARKPIVLALGALREGQVELDRLERLPSLQAYAQWLSMPQEWVGGFDLPFGLPRELVQSLGWPLAWRACIDHYAGLDRSEIRHLFAAFCASRPVGGKFAHRATDRPAGSSPSMKWVNPPVAYMLQAGVPPLLEAGVELPGLWTPEPLPGCRRVALEAYPGLLARELIGRRSYKSDDKARQTADRRTAREDLLHALTQGRSRLGLRLKLTVVQCDELLSDARGDSLDAALCLLQAAWAWCRHREGDARWGLPADLDDLEGWILSAPTNGFVDTLTGCDGCA